ncbi:hypothetical protein P691DRAFT_677518 [Macrolepiota fuliginosa MF-IS2]|uniref:F-box domain-containing protein n=1 Tax=Macrolepiota fuliginosa MF-IS2 TaxID=1400762 RepID=A0A9P5X0S0_9AGAR|nr:hypothetical protein P691DRAFT_680981 [Macrolepiota fuliginosa MF-IS2]KAF9444479.1 hypothetical protein P691DRAFT_677518 [Macrolepiota fuliginosa MF-IS2]
MPTNSPLPNEILATIFAHLEHPALALVARVSRRFNAVAEYRLYSLVVIADVLSEQNSLPQGTLCWYYAMLNRPHLADSVRRLQIRWTTESQSQSPPSPFLLDVCNRLSLIIRLLVGLEHLELFLGPANYVSLPQENIHAIERAVYHCILPALRFCSLGAEYTKGIQPYTVHITSFLCHTPSLRHFRLSDHHSSLSVPSAPHALPSLQTFRGSAATAASLLPGRPVHYISLIGQDSDVSQDNLQRMTFTTTPIRSLDLSAISARPVLLRNVSGYLPTLERLRIRLALRHTLHYALSGITLLVGLSSVLGAFPNLIYLDLSPTLEGGRANAADEQVLCTEYSRACPSLRTIVFPSQMEWIQDESNQWHMIGS